MKSRSELTIRKGRSCSLRHRRLDDAPRFAHTDAIVRSVARHTMSRRPLHRAMLTTMGAWRWAAARRHYTRHVHMVQACTPTCGVASMSRGTSLAPGCIRNPTTLRLRACPTPRRGRRAVQCVVGSAAGGAEFASDSVQAWHGVAPRWGRGQRGVVVTLTELPGHGEPALRRSPSVRPDWSAGCSKLGASGRGSAAGCWRQPRCVSRSAGATPPA